MCPCIVSIIFQLQPKRCNYFWFIYFYKALHVSGGSSTHHQEHITVHSASGIVNQYCCRLVSWMRWNLAELSFRYCQPTLLQAGIMDVVELSFRYCQPILLQAGIVDVVELSFRYCQPILLQAGIVDEAELSGT